ncbi:hypothetical protein ElyMa_005226400, partial [Elysia marginata]
VEPYNSGYLLATINPTWTGGHLCATADIYCPMRATTECRNMEKLRVYRGARRAQADAEAVGSRKYFEVSPSGGKTAAAVQSKRSRPISLRGRSCQLRLGGHCVTELLDKAMRQKNYLSSANSPGRKRRSLQANWPSKQRRRSLHSILTNHF